MSALEDDDDRLLERAAQDPEAFGLFYRRHERAVIGYFMRRTGDAELAADLTAETFAAALESACRYEPAGTPASAWLFGIARHKLMRASERRRVEDGARRRLGLPPLELDDELLRAIEQVGADQRVTELLDELPDDQAAAVRGRIVEEVPYGELANRMRCSEAVVRKRVSRGLLNLRHRFKEAS
jgi:RNA polymerase sigma-70 factor (ECF subfamily)